MLSRSAVLSASLRNRRPYWMMFLHNVDNWKIYQHIHEPDHQRTEMMYQAWLGGLDRPYTRPRCMAGQPVWLEKKRAALEKPDLRDPQTPLEQYVIEWRNKFQSFRGTLRPTADDLNTAFDLVERPLDLSYAIQLLNHCRNTHDIHFGEESFRLFVDACLRVDRKDVAIEAMNNADDLGFWHVDSEVKRFLDGERDEMPLEGSGSAATAASSFAAVSSSSSVSSSSGEGTGESAEEDSSSSSSSVDAAAARSGDDAIVDEDDELAKLEAELAALEAEEGNNNNDGEK